MDALQPSPKASRRLRPRPADLYTLGPLRPSERSLKTVHAYVSRSRLQHNADLLKSLIGPHTRLCAMVKANAYGLDARNVVAALASHVHAFAVASLEEAETIHPFANGHPILATCPLFAGIDPALVRLAQARSLHTTIVSPDALAYLQAALDPNAPPLHVHLKIDSGMGRLGCEPHDAPALLGALAHTPNLRLAGVYTHFATADEPDLDFAHEQLARFQSALQAAGFDQPRPTVTRHAANSSAALRLPAARLDMVRSGIALYGYLNHDDPADQPGFLPVVRVDAPVVQVRTLRQGQTCGYGRTFTAPCDLTVGIVPVGYADGLSRNLSNQAVMRHGPHLLPILGRISMDLTIIDLTNLPDPHEGMTVTVLDDQPDSPANAHAHARLSGTIPYEVLTSIGNRVKRVMTD